MIIGASLGSFRGLELESAMEFYLNLSNDFNLGVVEIRFEKEEGRPSLWPWEESDKLAGFLTNFEVRGAHLPFVYLNPISPNSRIKDESVKQLKMALDKAAGLNMNYAVMHARGFAYGSTHAQQLDEWEKVIVELTDYAKSRSILLTIENGDFLGNLKELVAIVRKINSRWLKITLDVGHAHGRRVKQMNHLLPYSLRGLALKALDMSFAPLLSKRYMPYEEYGSIENFLKSELDLVYSLHLHDHNGQRDHLAIGSGKIDFSFLPMVAELPLIIEADFSSHYQDFRWNYERLVNLAEQG